MSLCLWFGIAGFIVMLWVDVSNPKGSAASKQLWRIYHVGMVVLAVLVPATTVVALVQVCGAVGVCTSLLGVLLLAACSTLLRACSPFFEGHYQCSNFGVVDRAVRHAYPSTGTRSY